MLSKTQQNSPTKYIFQGSEYILQKAFFQTQHDHLYYYSVILCEGRSLPEPIAL